MILEYIDVSFFKKVCYNWTILFIVWESCVMSKFDRFLVDRKYVQVVGPRLDRFGMTTKVCHQARCPACGDSKKSKTKRRLCFVENDNNVYIYCHNCNRSWTMKMFIDEFFPDVSDQYYKEYVTASSEGKKDFVRIKKSGASVRNLLSKPTETKDVTEKSTSIFDLIDYMTPIIDTPKDSEEYQYLKKRGFTEEQMKYLFVTDDFKQLASVIDKHGDHSRMVDNDKRIVIPFINFKDSTVYAIQGRSLNPNTKMKYITIKESENTVKTFYKEPIDKSKTVYCVEGPIDSLFIDNSVAACDSNLTRADADVYIWDNEPCNKTTVDKIRKAVLDGKSVVVWDTSPTIKQDINDMVLSGYTKQQITDIINENTYNGHMAYYKWSKWKRF